MSSRILTFLEISGITQLRIAESVRISVAIWPADASGRRSVGSVAPAFPAARVWHAASARATMPS